MEKGPLVSVIIPIYGVEKYIGKCLKSLIEQSYGNLEVLVINDGTKDNSALIAKTYAEKDKRIKVFDFENGGVSLARNRGLAMAKGDYISFVDGDDWVHPSMYQDLVGLMLAEKPDIIKFSVDEVDVEANKVNTINFENKQVITEDTVSKYFEGVLYIMLCNGLYTREIATSVKFPVGLTYEDNYTAGMHLALARKIISIPQVYYYYRVNLQGASKTVSKRPLDKCIVVKMLIDDLRDRKIKVDRFFWKFATEIYHFIRGINSMYRVCAVRHDMYSFVKNNLDLRRKLVFIYLLYKKGIRII